MLHFFFDYKFCLDWLFIFFFLPIAHPIATENRSKGIEVFFGKLKIDFLGFSNKYEALERVLHDIPPKINL